MSKDEALANILFTINKKEIVYFCQLKHYIEKYRPELLDCLSDQRETIVNYLCKRRGILIG